MEKVYAVAFSTKAYPRRIKKPNSEKSWHDRLVDRSLNADKIPFPKAVWSRKGTFLTSPTDGKALLKVRHRALFLRGRDSNATNKSCRMCGKHKETVEHLVECPKLEPLKKAAVKILEAAGCNLATLHPLISWVLGITWDCEPEDTKPLPEFEFAVLQLYWRTLYRHLMLHERQKIARVVPALLVRDLGKILMTRILAYQQSKQRHHTKFACAGAVEGRTLSNAHPKEVERVSQLGELDPVTGDFEVRDTIKAVLIDLRAWKNFK